jgi:Tol biopolymer transport system component
MARLDHRFPLLILVSSAIVLLAVGCTTRPEANETLTMSGNHSAGDLVMVTADTSSDGFHYLNPAISPDGTRIAFSADWAAIPPGDRLPDVTPNIRQIAVTPNVVKASPMLGLGDSGANLVQLRQFLFLVGDREIAVFPHLEAQKGQPVWIDDDNLMFWVKSPQGARIFRVNAPPSITSTDLLNVEILHRELSDSEQFAEIPFWEHLSPALSPNGQWVAFSRYGYQDVDSLATTTKQSIWVFQMPEAGEVSELAFQVSGEGSQVDEPSWSPDGRTIVFQASTDVTGTSDSYFSKELFTVDFDPEALAEDGTMELNRNIQRLTFSEAQVGSPISIRNSKPVFSPDGQRIVFVSDRRVPTLTFTDKNIWWIPSDGSLDPQLVFFTRSDDVDPVFTGGPGNEILLSSSMGFPTEMLNVLEAEAYERILALEWQPNEVQAAALAASEREELEFFENVMSHLYLLSNW